MIYIANWIIFIVAFEIPSSVSKKDIKDCRSFNKRPNIIFILADDLGWDDVSFHGSNQIPTPNIDKLANEGVILNSHYVSPTGTPTRAALLTGKHSIKLGLQHGSIASSQPYGLPLDEVILPQYLKPLGYTTHGIGKWHLGFYKKEYTPDKRGFHTFFGFYNGEEDYWNHTVHQNYNGLDLRRNGKVVADQKGRYGTKIFTDEAVHIIERHDKSKPFFVYFAHQAVHTGNPITPLQAPIELIKSFQYIPNKQRRIYAAMVKVLDESVGRVVKALKKKKVYENTVIVFATDNGGAPNGMEKNWGCNFPLRGGKNTLWEGGVRGVAFVHSPLLIDKKRVSNEMIHVTDWLPTLYSVAGGDLDDIRIRLDGYNMWDVISQSMPSPRKEVLHNIDPITKTAAIRMGKYKLIVNQDMNYFSSWYRRFHSRRDPDDHFKDVKLKILTGAELTCSTVEKRDSTFDCDPSISPCLYNIETDPCEYDNLFSRKHKKAALLFHRLLYHQRHGKPALNPDGDEAANPIYFNGTWSPWQILENDYLVRIANRKIPHPQDNC
ncbi:arylsulfatase B-like [Xenia sp. Carnegie-2017]|uniref:arylsulfatase B-like n=1 Tax=Xenia sp. Carnegie-2017 TaxID=2897299 RepID=UPI001F03805F|nr:arylsulfatase B-like [Xenia sp. Carnegie-2017]